MDVLREGLGGASEAFRLQLVAKQAEVEELQQQVLALKAADTREFLTDNSDQLCAIVQNKNQVIQDLRAQLDAQGKDGLETAIDASTSATELHRLRELVSARDIQVKDLEQQLTNRPSPPDNIPQSGASGSQDALALFEERVRSQEQEMQRLTGDRDQQLAVATSLRAQVELLHAQAGERSLQVLPHQVVVDNERWQLQEQELQRLAAERAAERDEHAELAESRRLQMELQTRELEQLRAELAASAADKPAAQATLDDSALRAEIDGLREELAAAAAETNASQTTSENAAMHIELDQLRATLAAGSAEKAASQATSEQPALVEELEQLRGALAAANQAAAEERALRALASASQTTSEEAALRAELEQVRAALVAAAEEKGTRPASMSDQCETTGELIGEVAKLTKALEEANADIVKYRDLQSLSDRDSKAMRFQLETATREIDSGKAGAKDLSLKAQQFETQLARARDEVAELRRGQRQVGTSAVSAAASESAGTGFTASLVGHLRDLESGEAKCTTIYDLGLGNLGCVAPLDAFLQALSSIMAVRADARLGIFGVWMLCHFLYIFYLLYSHFA